MHKLPSTFARVLAIFYGLFGISASLQAQHIAGYVWPDDHTEHVLYVGRDDQHIHELWLAKGGGWHHNDLIQNNCNTPHPAYTNRVDVAGFASAEWNTEYVAYIDQYFHLNALWLKSRASGGDGCWHDWDLTHIFGGPAADPRGSVVAYEWPEDHSEHFVYKGLDGYIHEIYFGIAGAGTTDFYWAGPALGPIVGYVWPSNHSEHIVFIPQSGGILELYNVLGSGWSSGLSLPSYFNTGTALAGFAWPEDDSEHVFYVAPYGTTDSSAVDESYCYPGAVCWLYGLGSNNDSGDAPSGNPPLANSLAITGYVFPSDHSEHVMYVAFDNSIHELHLQISGGGWQHYAVSANSYNGPYTGGPGYPGHNQDVRPANPAAIAGYVWPEDGTEHVVYLSCDNQVNELYLLPGSVWVYNDLTQATNAPAAPGCPVPGSRRR
jgi:hypothetical protein